MRISHLGQTGTGSPPSPPDTRPASERYAEEAFWIGIAGNLSTVIGVIGVIPVVIGFIQAATSRARTRDAMRRAAMRPRVMSLGPATGSSSDEGPIIDVTPRPMNGLRRYGRRRR